MEDTEDILARTKAEEQDEPPPVPSKKPTKPKFQNKFMRVACYADDPKEPDLIGEVTIDLTEALTKGEVDGTSPHLIATPTKILNLS